MPNDGARFVRVSVECFVDSPGQKTVLEAMSAAAFPLLQRRESGRPAAAALREAVELMLPKEINVERFVIGLGNHYTQLEARLKIAFDLQEKSLCLRTVNAKSFFFSVMLESSYTNMTGRKRTKEPHEEHVERSIP